jgi:hypothetical protein
MKVTIGVERSKKVGNGFQRVQHNADILDIDLAEDECLSVVWIYADGEPVAQVPLWSLA